MKVDTLRLDSDRALLLRASIKVTDIRGRLEGCHPEIPDLGSSDQADSPLG